MTQMPSRKGWSMIKYAILQKLAHVRTSSGSQQVCTYMLKGFSADMTFKLMMLQGYMDNQLSEKLTLSLDKSYDNKLFLPQILVKAWSNLGQGETLPCTAPSI